MLLIELVSVLAASQCPCRVGTTVPCSLLRQGSALRPTTLAYACHLMPLAVGRDECGQEFCVEANSLAEARELYPECWFTHLEEPVDYRKLWLEREANGELDLF